MTRLVTLLVAPVLIALGACGNDASNRAPMCLSAIEPSTLTARGGVVTLKGSGFEAGVRAFVREGDVEVRFLDGSTVELVVPPMLAGPAPLRLERGAEAIESAEGLRIEPIPLQFVSAESWRLPTIGGVTGVARTPAGLFAGTSAGLVSLSYEDGQLVAFAPPPPEGEVAVPIGRFVVAMNGDRAVTCSADGRLLGWSTRASSGFTSPVPVPMPEGAICGAMQVTGGSPPEVLVVLQNAGIATLDRLVLGVDGPVWSTPATPSLPAAPDVLRLFDLDHDGLDDLLLGGPFGVRVWRGAAPVAGQARFVEEPVLPSRTARTFDVLPFDVDEDGALDLLVAGDGQDALYVNDGFGHFFDDAFRLLPFERTRGRSIARGDLDLDGVADLVIATDDGPDRLFRATTSGFIDETPSLGLGAASRSRTALLDDLDADGDLDLLTTDADGVLHVKFLVEPVEAP